MEARPPSGCRRLSDGAYEVKLHDGGSVTLSPADVEMMGILYDPVVDAGSLMEVTLERPIEVPAALVRDNMQEPERGGKWQGLYTPQGCYGLCEPFAGHAKDAPEGRRARVPGGENEPVAATAVRLAATDRSAEPGMGPLEEER